MLVLRAAVCKEFALAALRHHSGGNGLLRLHSTYRHDLKIYSSDEGRVQVRAARAQGFRLSGG